jgi:hypothetical protein
MEKTRNFAAGCGEAEILLGRRAPGARAAENRENRPDFPGRSPVPAKKFLLLRILAGYTI